jgi:hypothetical protein
MILGNFFPAHDNAIDAASLETRQRHRAGGSASAIPCATRLFFLYGIGTGAGC